VNLDIPARRRKGNEEEEERINALYEKADEDEKLAPGDAVEFTEKTITSLDGKKKKKDKDEPVVFKKRKFAGNLREK
jgi:hypothetical protein